MYENRFEEQTEDISIHASAKEATMMPVQILPSLRIFQSTLPRRKRRDEMLYIAVPDIFQSTLPRRKRLKTWQEEYGQVNFNPRFREGSDKTYNGRYSYNHISIHASAKEATG